MAKRKTECSNQSIETSAIEHVMGHPAFKKELEELAEIIRSFASSAPNEATLAANFELKIYSQIMKRLHIEFKPSKEEAVNTIRHVKKGRIDSRIGVLVIEYKQKNKLETVKNQAAAEMQLKNYIQHLPEDIRHGAVGVLTDGWRIKFISFQEQDVFAETAFENLNGNHILRLIRGILSLDKKALTPKNLIEGFCSGSLSPSKQLALALYDVLQNKPTERTKMLLKEWQALFKLAHDDQSKQSAIEERRMALAEALDINIVPGDNEMEYRALYAIQTSYAIIVKVIAFKVLSSIRSAKIEKSFEKLSQGSDDSLRTHLNRLESGAIFRDEGFGNLLEGDFFAWYCTKEQWSISIGNAVKKIFAILSEYENHHMFDDARVQDLFKDIYMAIIPDKVRHSLGEFYTPPWLADHTLLEALSALPARNKWSSLDPCCGSGTFITVMIRTVLDEVKDLPHSEQLKQVLGRVKGIDLNPLAVLTTRINYFINLSHLISEHDEFDVPVYLGDASYTPTQASIGEVTCLRYQIGTEQGPLNLLLPMSAVSNVARFSKTMSKLETHIEGENEASVYEELCAIISSADLTIDVQNEIKILSKKLVDLHRNKWNGIWARIICNFLTTANLGKFDIVVSNPPWIDWKNLPQGYREKIKELCISRDLFSGDGITGGINLNVCALIANVAAQNWLKHDGILAFLMPENLIFQQSYEGFRNFHLDNGKKLYFQKLVDWTKSGHPFSPVQHRFLAFFIGATVQNYNTGILVEQYVKSPKKKGENILPLHAYFNVQKFNSIKHVFKKNNLLAVTTNENNSTFSYAANITESKMFSAISGKCPYIGREGVEVFPQELFLLTVDESKPIKNNKVYVKNFQNPRSKHKIAAGEFLLETDFLYPLIKGVDIERFHINQSNFVVPFPYDYFSRAPISNADLAKRAPNLMKYFNNNKDYFDAQTKYNDKIIGKKHKGEFYALARVGEYSYGDYFVAFRDNTKWQAAVVSSLPTTWDKNGKRPIFQNHAVSISQRENKEFITFDEAHYICAIFNAPIVNKYLINSSDSRSFKIRPPINVPQFDPTNSQHQALASLSKQAHISHHDKHIISLINTDLDRIYLSILQTVSS
ncbi:MAG: N-6 DNA methylase [Legionellales bacterium]|nr:N-6 DNA methylase [Legionellales bacterium]